ncbi:hypothetical protein PN471_20585, partial [Aphanizomenon sp. CS-733/32]|nr:hypothetical protein [Aphanizomenon sp. CS-733/32]
DSKHTQWYKRPDWFAVLEVSRFYEQTELQQIVIKPGTRTPPPTPSPQAMRGLRCTLYDWKSL